MNLKNIRTMLCDELERYGERRSEISDRDLDAIQKLTSAIKNIDKIEMLEGLENAGFENGTEWNDEESRAKKPAAREKSEMEERIEEIMREAKTDKEREALRRCIGQLRS